MFGEIDGVTEGQIFESRRELHDANVHNGLMRGMNFCLVKIIAPFVFGFFQEFLYYHQTSYLNHRSFL